MWANSDQQATLELEGQQAIVTGVRLIGGEVVGTKRREGRLFSYNKKSKDNGSARRAINAQADCIPFSMPCFRRVFLLL